MNTTEILSSTQKCILLTKVVPFKRDKKLFSGIRLIANRCCDKEIINQTKNCSHKSI